MGCALWDLLFGKKPRSAEVAKGRLLFTIAHERANRNLPDYFIALQPDLIELISRYINTDPTAVQIQREKQDDAEILNIVLPEADTLATKPVVEPRRSLTDLWFGKKGGSAEVAKERLMIMIARDGQSHGADYFPELQKEITLLIAETLSIDPATIKVQREHQERCEILNIVLPERKF